LSQLTEQLRQNSRAVAETLNGTAVWMQEHLNGAVELSGAVEWNDERMNGAVVNRAMNVFYIGTNIGLRPVHYFLHNN